MPTQKSRCPCCGGSLDPAQRGKRYGDPIVCLSCNVDLVLDHDLVPRVRDPWQLATVLAEDLGFVEIEPVPRRRTGGRGR